MIEENESHVVGIDLGTSYSCVSVWKDGNFIIIPDDNGNHTIPSIVSYTPIHCYVGNEAKKQKELNPKNTFFEVKRLIGRKYNDKIVSRERQLFPYDILKDERENVSLITSYGKIITPEEILAKILNKLKKMASKYLKCDITKAVITVPAEFNDGQRQATKDAAKIAELECIRLIDEPVAAALAYGMLERSIMKKTLLDEVEKNEQDMETKTEVNVIVYDFGGGTLDVSYLTIDNGIFDVISSSGNSRLGGSDFDNRIIKHAMEIFKKMNNISVLDNLDRLSLQKLRTSCELAKITLSQINKTHIAVPKFFNDIDLYINITRSEFETICRDLFMLAIKPIDDILRANGIESDEIDDIILVGGMTRIPRIRNLIEIKLNKKPNCSINPDEAISAGASMQAYIITHLNDPLSKNIHLQNVTSLSLGVEVSGGIMNVLIPRGTKIPVEKSRDYTTDSDYVDSVNIKVFEGERTMTKDNFFVGEFELTGIEKAPRGIAEIEVTFTIDVNGIITVKAENSKTNDLESIIVNSNKNRLSELQIQNLILESRESESKDEYERRLAMMYYQIDDLCGNILVNINRSDIKLTDSNKEKIINEVHEINKWNKSKKYNERELCEYNDIIKKMEEKYGMLLLKGVLNENKVESMSENTTATIIFGDDEEDEKIKHELFEKIECEETGLYGLTDSEKAEIIQIRENIHTTCYEIFGILTSNSLNGNEHNISELRNFVDDTLMWLYSCDKPTKYDYRIKLDELNDICDKFIEQCNSDKCEVFKDSVSDKNSCDKLIDLCAMIKVSMDNNLIPIDKGKQSHMELYNKLFEEIDNVFTWLLKENLFTEQVDEIKKSETVENMRIEQLKQCTDYYDKINELSEELYNLIQGTELKLNLENPDLIFPDGKTEQDMPVPQKSDINITDYLDISKFDNDDENSTKCGTSIYDVMCSRQNKILDECVENGYKHPCSISPNEDVESSNVKSSSFDAK